MISRDHSEDFNASAIAWVFHVNLFESLKLLIVKSKLVVPITELLLTIGVNTNCPLKVLPILSFEKSKDIGLGLLII